MKILMIMKHKELCSKLEELHDLYSDNLKYEKLSKIFHNIENTYPIMYDTLIIKCGYKFLSITKFFELCNSSSPWPQELLINEEDPIIKLNAFRFKIYNNSIEHRICIWNDIESSLVWFQDISIPNNKLCYRTSIQEIQKYVLSILDGRYYIPIEMNEEPIENDNTNEEDVYKDIKEILEEDLVHENNL